ncbi:MAG: hypothetical protein COT37_00180 [Parcubacteria group bacterium CG08_land_8_20_14_0_20_43_9]|nr:MAG: hypothetical protein COT37_00180 [Parcubacteria group bacterium CG08_land_8_20_14_0_20_43_9]
MPGGVIFGGKLFTGTYGRFCRFLYSLLALFLFAIDHSLISAIDNFWTALSQISWSFLFSVSQDFSFDNIFRKYQNGRYSKIMFINFRKLLKSFKVAFSGLRIGIKEENTVRIGAIIAAIVVFFMFYFPLNLQERAIIILCIFLVLSIELMNTQVEKVTNLIDRNYNREIRKIKNLAAGAVLLAVIGAGAVAGFIFLPHIVQGISHLFNH